MSCCSTIGVRPAVRTERPVSAGCRDTRAGRGPSLMARIPAGLYYIGSDGSEAYAADGEGPRRSVSCREFLIDQVTVTNHQFAEFVAATGYVTDAERFGWSFVFYAQVHPKAAATARPAAFGAPRWWLAVPGACWKAPDGPGSDYRERDDHPVVHVSWNDATAFTAWADFRLPSDAEWEIAARGGLDGRLYPWGDELQPADRHMCNIWQGRFPIANTCADGYLATAPSRSFPPNGYGLYNMAGNVWEWCADAFNPSNTQASQAVGTATDQRVMRGGSYLCHESHCNRYRVSARTGNERVASASNIGFRCASDAAPPYSIS
jgi:formylglycine-generating enzyme